MSISKIIIKINQKNLINNIDSRYWIADVLAEVCYSSEKTYRKVMVEIFDRELKQKNDLKSITFKINDIEYKCSSFCKTSDYTWKCDLEIPVAVEQVVLFIQSYNLLDETVEYLNPSRYLQGLDYVEDKLLFNICKDVLHKEKVLLAPYYNNMLWYCLCGKIHSVENNKCTCGMCLGELQQLCKANKDELVLNNAKEGLKVNLEENVSLTLKNYSNMLSNKYGVNADNVLSSFSVNDLENEQKKLIDQKCREYLETNKLDFDIHKSFDNNIDSYTKKGSEGLLTSEYIKNKLDIEKLMIEYSEKKELYDIEQQKKVAKRNKIIVVSLVCVVVVFLVTVLVDMLTPKAEGVVQMDSLENREKSFNEDEIEHIYDYDYTSGFVNVFEEYSDILVDSADDINTWYDLQEKMKNEGIFDVNSFLYKKKISPNISHINIDDVNIPKAQSIDDKNLYALSENYFLVKEVTKIEEDKEKIEFYIGDKKGNKKYGDNQDYVISELENEKISRQFIYKNGVVIAKRTYQYEDKKLKNSYYYELKSQSVDLDNSDSWELIHEYHYKDNLVVEKHTDDGYNKFVKKFKYEGKKLVSEEIFMKESDASEDSPYLQKSICKYENGILINKESTARKFREETKYHYDSNGLLSSLETVTESYGDIRKTNVRYIYDFENGCIYIVTFSFNDGVYEVVNIGYNSYKDGLSHFNVSNEKSATTVTSLTWMDLSENFMTIYGY